MHLCVVTYLLLTIQCILHIAPICSRVVDATVTNDSIDAEEGVTKEFTQLRRRLTSSG